MPGKEILVEGTQQRILLVEDSHFLRGVMARQLMQAGYEVLTSGDGEDALVRALAERPDLILLDLILPKIEGFEVLRRLRANATTAVIPVIVLSSLNPEAVLRAFGDGAPMVVNKSESQLSELLGTIETVLREESDQMN